MFYRYSAREETGQWSYICHNKLEMNPEEQAKILFDRLESELVGVVDEQYFEEPRRFK